MFPPHIKKTDRNRNYFMPVLSLRYTIIIEPDVCRKANIESYRYKIEAAMTNIYGLHKLFMMNHVDETTNIWYAVNITIHKIYIC